MLISIPAHLSCLAYGELPPLANGVSARLRAQLQSASSNCAPKDPKLGDLEPVPVVAILCPSGLDFFAHALAVWYLGCALLPIALGTTTEGIANLLDKTGACALLTHASQTQSAEQTLKSSPQCLTEVVQMVDSLAAQPIQERTEPLHISTPHSTLIIFHSSGSSGLPKPIYHVHRFWAYSLASAAGTDIAAFTTTPLFHGGMSDFFRSLQAASAIFFHPITGHGNPLSIPSIRDSLNAAAPIGYFLTVPFILEMLSKSDEGIELLNCRQLVSTGGAPLPTAIGNLLVERGVPLVSRLGSSECGFLMSSFRDFASEKDWDWLRAQETYNGQRLLEFREHDDNPGLFELVVTGAWPTKLLSNTDNNCYSTEDLYVCDSGRYQYATRADDTLVLINGKKFAAGLMETRLKTSEAIQDAVVFGSNRALVGALVIAASLSEPIDKYSFVQSLRPHLNSLNERLPPHARIQPELVVIADAALAASIPRSSKGTLQRGQAYRKLEPLFDDTYRNYEQGTISGYPAKRSLRGQELRQWLAELTADIIGTAEPIAFDQDFHAAGINSIGATRLKASINQSIDCQRLNDNVVYEQPTVEALAAHIEALQGDNQRGTTRRDDGAQMRDIVQRHIATLPSWQSRKPGNGPRTIILTGATGALGSALLCALLSRSTSDRIVCLIRSDSDDAAAARLRQTIKQRRLDSPVDGHWDRISAYASRIDSKSDLGIRSSKFHTEVEGAGDLQIVHAAWSVNFAMSLQSFEKDNIQSLGYLLSWGLENGASAFVFCSSLASVLAGSSSVVEAQSFHPQTAGTVGYSQSKWVAEAIVAAAGKDGGLRTCNARIGQLCSDSQTGIWNESEAWPLMVRVASELGRLPRIPGQEVDWLPVDIAASAICKVLGQEGFFHICLPESLKRPSWDDFLGWLQNAGLSFETIELDEWLKEVEHEGGRIRGRSLLSIWKGLGSGDGVKVQTDRTNPALEGARTMDARLAEKTVRHWQAEGFLF